MSLGFEQAGFDVVAAIEIDPVHAAVHKFNFPECTVIPKSVRELTGDAIRNASNIGDQEIDVVFGGAPCQGFSLIGQRALDDPRNSLAKDFVRLVRELSANYFVFENVKGLTVGKHRKFLDEIIGEFINSGYDVRTEWRVLNAYNYGVPQDRQRLFLLGAKKGLTIPDYPSAISSKPGLSVSKLPSSPTCADALDDLPDAENFRQLIDSDQVKTTKRGTPSTYALLMRCEVPASWAFGYQRIWDAELLTSSMRSMHTDISRQRFSNTKPGEVEPISRFLRLPKTGVSNTLRAGTDSARGAFTSPRPIHYKWNRCITVREMARLHGFPDWFRFNQTKWHGARQIGNAVPPPLGKAVASKIMVAIGKKPVKPKRKIKLENSDLLRMGMNEASTYWGIKNPISNRNRNIPTANSSQTEIRRKKDSHSKSIQNVLFT